MSLQESMSACIVYEAYKEERCTVSQNKSIAPSKIDILMDTFLDNRHLPAGCSTLTPSNVTSECITPDSTTELTNVCSTK